MCTQCWSSAAAMMGAATGARAWLGARFGAYLTPRRQKALTITILGLGVVGSSLGLAGTG